MSRLNLKMQIRKTNQMSLLYSLFLFHQLLKMFRATMCPSSGADDCVMLQPCVGMCRGCRKVVKYGWQVVRPWTLQCRVLQSVQYSIVYTMFYCAVQYSLLYSVHYSIVYTKLYCVVQCSVYRVHSTIYIILYYAVQYSVLQSVYYSIVYCILYCAVQYSVLQIVQYSIVFTIFNCAVQYSVLQSVKYIIFSCRVLYVTLYCTVNTLYCTVHYIA